MRKTFSKRVIAVVLAVMMVITMVPMISITASAASKTIKTLAQLKYYADYGGTYVLDADIELTDSVIVRHDFTLDGKGHTLTAKSGVGRMLDVSGGNATVTNTTFDVNDQNTTACFVSNNGELTLENCIVKNAKKSSYVGAICQEIYSKGTYNNCTFINNQCLKKDGNNTTGADIWAGAGAEVHINGGSYNQVFINADSGNAGKLTVEGNAVIAEVVLENDGKTATATIADTATVNVKTNVDTFAELKTAAANGGSYILGKDIAVTENVNVAKNLTIDGNGQTLTATNGAKRIFDTADAPVVLTFSDLTLDCNNVADYAIHTSEEKIANQDTAVYMTDCTVKNSISDSYLEGAVYLYSRATGCFENCTFENNNINDEGQWAYASGADIWAGAATKVTITGGYYSQVFINANKGGGGNVKVEGGAVITELTLESDGYTATATIDPTATVTKVNVGPKEAVLTEGGKIIGTSGECATPDADDEFSKDNPFTKNFELMGVQRKSDAENAIRFVSVIDAKLIAAADDYGYIIGTTTKDRLTAMQNAGNITLENVPHLAVSCKGTSNQIYNNYGEYDADTNYKYVTAAIENITDPSKTILARVYVKCGDKTYYGDYITTDKKTYEGCATSLADFVNA